MPMIQFSERDMLRGEVVEPAWYVVNIEQIGEAPSKDGNSTNYPVEAKIVKNADNGNEEFCEAFPSTGISTARRLDSLLDFFRHSESGVEGWCAPIWRMLWVVRIPKCS